MEFIDYHADNFVDVLEGFLSSPSPGGGSMLAECRAMRMPTILVRLDDHFECVRLHALGQLYELSGKDLGQVAATRDNHRIEFQPRGQRA